MCCHSPRAWVDFPNHEILWTGEKGETRLANIAKQLGKSYTSLKAARVLKGIEQELWRKPRLASTSEMFSTTLMVIMMNDNYLRPDKQRIARTETNHA